MSISQTPPPLLQATAVTPPGRKPIFPIPWYIMGSMQGILWHAALVSRESCQELGENRSILQVPWCIQDCGACLCPVKKSAVSEVKPNLKLSVLRWETT